MGRVQVIVPACFYILAGEAFQLCMRRAGEAFQLCMRRAGEAFSFIRKARKRSKRIKQESMYGK